MAYGAPSTRTTGTLITAAIWNQDVVANPAALYAGALALPSQAARDFLFATSATQLGRVAAGTAGQALLTKGAGADPVLGFPNVRTLTSISAAYTALTTDDIIAVTAGTFTLSLYAAAGNSGRALTIKNIGGGVVTVDANGAETIDGATTLGLLQYASATMFCDGSNWHTLPDPFRVAQIATFSYSTQISSASAILVDTGLTGTITLKSTANKVIVLAFQAGCGKDTNNTALRLVLLRDGVSLHEFERSGAQNGGTSQNYIGTCATVAIDTSGGTGVRTYKTQLASTAGLPNTYVQSSGSVSTLLLIEVSP
ncbi:MAG TPA: hypothetical protein VNJ02_10530 [Vicinamibacterales bacterium]|nr:hypothetical protein [Vicinamibacterales bacterium]